MTYTETTYSDGAPRSIHITRTTKVKAPRQTAHTETEKPVVASTTKEERLAAIKARKIAELEKRIAGFEANSEWYTDSTGNWTMNAQRVIDELAALR